MPPNAEGSSLLAPTAQCREGACHEPCCITRQARHWGSSAGFHKAGQRTPPWLAPEPRRARAGERGSIMAPGPRPGPLTLEHRSLKRPGQGRKRVGPFPAATIAGQGRTGGHRPPGVLFAPPSFAQASNRRQTGRLPFSEPRKQHARWHHFLPLARQAGQREGGTGFAGPRADSVPSPTCSSPTPRRRRDVTGARPPFSGLLKAPN